MKVLSLCQPYASLLILGLKKWETRGWKPGARSMKMIEKEGLMIHASLSKRYNYLMGEAPFSSYLEKLGKMPYGAILGQVRLGKMVRTEQWMAERVAGPNRNIFTYTPPVGQGWDEYYFGDYEDGRWAWEILEPELFPEPIPCKGSLSLWNSPYLPKQPVNAIW